MEEAVRKASREVLHSLRHEHVMMKQAAIEFCRLRMSWGGEKIGV